MAILLCSRVKFEVHSCVERSTVELLMGVPNLPERRSDVHD
jgi:hypothetical protein